MICNFLAANVSEEIKYGHKDFILRETLGHRNPLKNSGIEFYFQCKLNILG